LGTMSDEKAREIIGKRELYRYTENSITDPEAYLQAVRIAREKGYATDYEEYILGVRAVASPIKAENHLVSAIWVVGFKTSLNDHKMEGVIRRTKESAEKITHSLERQYML
jgi:DNA-binding IclR family transcriptional regulator